MTKKFIDPRSGTETPVGDRIFRSESARDLFTTLYKRRALYWVVLIVFAAAFYFFAMQLPTVYTAHARVRFDSRLDRELSQDADNPERFRYRMMSAPDVAAEIQLFQAREVRAKVAEDPEIYSLPPYQNMPLWDTKPQDERVREWMNYLYQNFTAEGVPQTNLVVLKFEDWSPDRAAMIANKLGRAYVEHRTQPSEAHRQKVETLRGGMQTARAAFQDAIAELDQFRQENGVAGGSATEGVAKLQDSEAAIAVRLADAESSLSGLNARRDAVAAIDRTQLDLMKALPEIGANNLIKSLEDEIRILRGRYNREMLKSTEAHAPAQLAKSELDDARARHDAAVLASYDGLLYQLETNIAEKVAEVESFQLERETIREEIQRLARVQPQLDEKLVEYDSKREAYELAQKRLSSAEASGAQAPEVLVSLAGEAAPPPQPSMPPPVWLIAILAVALGLFMAVTTVFIAGYLDRTLDTPGEAERELGLPVLATIQNERGHARKRRKRR